jgi:hypothetical protein
LPSFTAAYTSRLDTAGVAGGRNYWVKVPQNATLPYTRSQVVSDDRPEHLKGVDGARVSRIQTDCFAETFGASRTLAELVIATMSPPATVDGIQFGHTAAEGPRDLGEDISGKFIHMASLDLLVEHKLV